MTVRETKRGSAGIVLPHCDTLKGYIWHTGGCRHPNEEKGMFEIMKESKITIRPTAEEYREIHARAEAANMSVNRFLIESAIRPAPRNDKQLSALMGQLCRLEICVQRASELNGLKRDIYSWRQMTMRIMEGN